MNNKMLKTLLIGAGIACAGGYGSFMQERGYSRGVRDGSLAAYTCVKRGEEIGEKFDSMDLNECFKNVARRNLSHLKLKDDYLSVAGRDFFTRALVQPKMFSRGNEEKQMSREELVSEIFACGLSNSYQHAERLVDGNFDKYEASYLVEDIDGFDNRVNLNIDKVSVDGKRPVYKVKRKIIFRSD